jgi:Fe-S cluster assembly protein SufD
MSTMTTDQPQNLTARLAAMEAGGLSDLRSKAMARFEHIGWPSRRDEAWRYTDTRSLAATRFAPADPNTTVDAAVIQPFLLDADTPRLVFHDGVYQPTLSTASNMAGVRIERLATLDDDPASPLRTHLGSLACWEDDPACALSTALWTDGVLVELEPGASMASPLHILFVNQGGPTPISVHPRVLIIAGDGSRGTVIESHVGCSDHTMLSTPVTELLVGDGVELDHYRLVREGGGTWHLGDLSLKQGSTSTVSSCTLAFDGPLIRNRMRAHLAGENSKAILHGLALGHGSRHIDNLLRVEHMVPNCRSRESFKHILEDTATAAFTGRIYGRGPDQSQPVAVTRRQGHGPSAAGNLRRRCQVHSRGHGGRTRPRGHVLSAGPGYSRLGRSKHAGAGLRWRDPR